MGARALQGAFAALLAPAALSIVTTTFTDPAERGKAFGIYGAHRERRRRRRAPARRIPHRAPDLALDHVPEPGASRSPRPSRRGRLLVNMRPAQRPTHRRAGRAGRNLGPLRPRLRVLQRRDGQLERSAHHRPARRSASSRSPRSSQSSGGWPRRSCRCGWSATATGVRPSWLSRSRASRRSRRSSS